MQHTPATLAKTLRAKGFRITPQRLDILAILCANQHITPTEIFRQLHQTQPNFTEPTVYRTLEFLCEQGIVSATHIGNGRLQYELTLNDHHHFHCVVCDSISQIPFDEMQGLFTQLEINTGFWVSERHLTLNGLCPQCRKRND